MEPSFWHRCWERNSLGFHQAEIHPFLTQYFDAHRLATDRHVFVPLCGKSLDMVYLAQRLQVTGAELSEIACRDFFIEKGVSYQEQLLTGPNGDVRFRRFYVENMQLFQGDFFQLFPAMLDDVDWIYDRAALIALPPALRAHYAQHLRQFIGEQTRLFLISLEFPAHELTGPPFPVFTEEIKQLFAGLKVELLATRPLENKQFAQRTFNVSHLTEHLYLISRK